MSSNFNPPNPVQPLSLGNVISAGLRLYSSHLKSYLGLAFNSYLWVIVPVYGWAKCSAILALISRLSFGELVNQPETVKSGRNFVNSRLWQFLLMGLLMLVVFSGFAFALLILYGILAAVFIGFFSASSSGGNTPNPAIIFLIAILGIIAVFSLFIALLWVQSRLFLVEVPLAVEDNVDATSTISRSWELTKGHVWRIMGILFVSYLLTIPIQAPFSAISFFLQILFIRLAETQGNPALISFWYLINLALNLRCDSSTFLASNQSNYLL